MKKKKKKKKKEKKKGGNFGGSNGCVMGFFRRLLRMVFDASSVIKRSWSKNETDPISLVLSREVMDHSLTHSTAPPLSFDFCNMFILLSG
ncbi:hypothetical protein SDJN03_06251, partial [Cucurbita argyrosperma subsp. sororia]